MRAVLDAVGSERVALIGLAHGAALCSVFAATYPERTAGLVLWSHALKGIPEAWQIYRVVVDD